jgi:uncharacterized protein
MKLLLAAFAVCLSLPAAALDVPYLSARVNDDAHMLSVGAVQTLEANLKAYEAQTGRQFVVLTVPSLGDEALEDFSLKVARAWKLGTKGKDDGILFLIARDDHKLRFEVGYGLEGELPDARCGRIIRSVVVPRLRAGDADGAVSAGVDAVLQTLKGQDTLPPEVPGRGHEPEMAPFDKFVAALLLVGFLGVFEMAGLVTPGTGWALYFFLIPFWAIFPMALLGSKIGAGFLGTHLIGFPILKMILPKTEWGQRMARNIHSHSSGSGGSYGTGGFMGGSSSGGSDWSSGGGGFSGGGGSFGGGGASGSW